MIGAILVENIVDDELGDVIGLEIVFATLNLEGQLHVLVLPKAVVDEHVGRDGEAETRAAVEMAETRVLEERIVLAATLTWRGGGGDEESGGGDGQLLDKMIVGARIERMGGEAIGIVGVGEKIAHEGHLLAAGLKDVVVVDGRHGEVVGHTIDGFRLPFVACLVEILSPKKFFDAMSIVDDEHGLGRGLKAIAKPMDGGRELEAIIVGQQPDESGRDVVVGDQMREDGRLAEQGRMDDERDMVEMQLVLLSEARGMVARDDEDGVLKARDSSARVDEMADAVSV